MLCRLPGVRDDAAPSKQLGFRDVGAGINASLSWFFFRDRKQSPVVGYMCDGNYFAARQEVTVGLHKQHLIPCSYMRPQICKNRQPRPKLIVTCMYSERGRRETSRSNTVMTSEDITPFN